VLSVQQEVDLPQRAAQHRGEHRSCLRWLDGRKCGAGTVDSSQVIDFLLAATPCQCLVPFVTLSSRQEPFLTPGSPAPRSSRFNSLTPRPAPDRQRDPHAATREVAPPACRFSTETTPVKAERERRRSSQAVVGGACRLTTPSHALCRCDARGLTAHTHQIRRGEPCTTRVRGKGE